MLSLRMSSMEGQALNGKLREAHDEVRMSKDWVIWEHMCVLGKAHCLMFQKQSGGENGVIKQVR